MSQHLGKKASSKGRGRSQESVGGSISTPLREDVETAKDKYS